MPRTVVKYPAINTRELNAHLQILGDTPLHCVLSTMYKWNREKGRYTPKGVLTNWLLTQEVIPHIEAMNSQGMQVWVSLNEKVEGQDNVKGVNRIHTIWVDIDAPRGKKNIPATWGEVSHAAHDALRFSVWMCNTYRCIGFTALSGNGFHIYYPVHSYYIAPGNRVKFNDKHREFLNTLRQDSGINVDATTDIRRVAQPIGGLNLKIPNKPLTTGWTDRPTKADIEIARNKNQVLIEEILKTKVPSSKASKTVGGTQESNAMSHKAQERLDLMLALSDKARNLFDGRWQHYPQFATNKRSAAELSLITMLFQNGFTEGEVRSIMETCKIGKWQESQNSYRDKTIARGMAHY